MRSTPHELEELLTHGPWVRALAPCGSPRGWFATVLRNLARF